MKGFMNDGFLLSSEMAELLWGNYASKIPVIDFNCEISARDIADNAGYSNIAELWISGDKKRQAAMRSAGVDEKYITGNASDYEKFREYCKVMPSFVGNPIYVMTHLELRFYFDCELTVNEANCDEIWQVTSESLRRNGMRARDFIESADCVLLCLPEDPANDLSCYKTIANDKEFNTQIIPSFCPEKLFDIGSFGIKEYISRLGQRTGAEISDIKGLFSALGASLDRFGECGCKIARHNMANYTSFVLPDEYHADLILKKALLSGGKNISDEERMLFAGEMMYFFGAEYKKRGFTLLVSSEHTLDGLFAYLSEKGVMPRTVPCFLDSELWETKNRLLSFAERGALGRFVGMSAGSGSVTALLRHKYFRRILCDAVGEIVESGLYPEDYEALAQIVCDVCYNNAKNAFEFDLK